MWNFILSNRSLINYTNDKRRITIIISIAVIILLAAILLKCNCKLAYKVTIDGTAIGYVTDKDEFTCMITNKVLNQDNKNIELVVLNEIPKYSLAIINKNQQTDEESIISTLKLKADVTYKLYAITLDGEDKAYVNTFNEAKEKVNELTETYKEKIESEFGIREVYTENIFEYNNMKYATVTKFERNLENEEQQKAAEEKAVKEAEEAARIAATSTVNGIPFTTNPVSGRISSRYGANESIRNHTHKGLDIAAPNGTPILAAADGVIKCAQYNSGGYGNLVIISHGNGVETYYGHCSKLYVSVGQTVSAGDTIAAVGSTGNSTGNHLHFEIRIDGNQVNPQNYLYN